MRPVGKIIIGVLIIGVVIFVFLQKSDNTKASYYNEKLNFSLSYSNHFSLAEIEAKGDPQQPVILDITSIGRKIIIVPSIRPLSEVEQEEAFYENLLFGNPEQTANYHIEINPNLKGFKSKIPNVDKSLYTLYMDIDEAQALTIRSEITASSTQALLEAENEFAEIMESINFP